MANITESADKIVVGLVQMSMTDDMNANLEKAISGIRVAATRGADIVCLPELFRSPYFCIEEKCPNDYSEELPGTLVPILSDLSKELQITLVAGSVHHKTDNGLYNTTVIFDSNGSFIGDYKKTHIPHDPAFFEQNYFKSSEDGFKIFETVINGRKTKIGTLICYDQWFPEAARSLALMGAEIIFYPTAIGTVDGVDQSEGYWHDAWKTVQRGHAISNATAVVAVNRVGRENKSVFWGGSFVCNAFGHVLAEGTSSEQVIIAEVDLALNQQVKDGWRFFSERKPEAYSLLTKAKK